MNIGKQVSWVMVRAIGLFLVVYSLTHLVTALGSGYVAYTLRDHAAIVIRSDAPIPSHQKDTPQNRQLQKAQGQAQAAATLNFVLFLLFASAGVYCLKGGKALQKLLMPPEEGEQELT